MKIHSFNLKNNTITYNKTNDMKDLMDLGKKVAIAGGKEAMKYLENQI